MMALLDQAVVMVALLLGAGTLHALVALALSEAAVETLQPLFTGLWLCLYAWAAAKLVVWHGGRWVQWLVRKRVALLAVLAIATCSVLWSVQPALTAQRSIHLLGTSLFAVYVGYHLTTRALISVLTAFLYVLIIGGMIVALVLPDIGLHEYEGKMVWRGLQQEKNTFGLASTTALLFFFVRSMSVNREKPFLDWIICAMSAVTLVMSDSATSMGALLIGLTLILCFLIQAGGRMSTLVPLFGVGSGICVIVLYFLLSASGAGVFELFGRSSDITGRTVIWSGVLGLVEKHALFGLGYGGIWFPRPQDGWLQMSLLGTNWMAFHAHNGLLQVASELGLVAAMAAVVLLVQSFAEAVRAFLRTSQPIALFLIGFNAAFILVNFFEALFLTDRNPVWILYLALPIALMRSASVSAVGQHPASGGGRGVTPFHSPDPGLPST